MTSYARTRVATVSSSAALKPDDCCEVFRIPHFAHASGDKIYNCSKQMSLQRAGTQGASHEA